MTNDERTRDRIARKLSEGKTKKEAIRCLCHFIAREVYKLMAGPQEPLPDCEGLAQRRRDLSMTQVFVTDLLGMHKMKVSRLERGIAIDLACLKEYDSMLSSFEPGDVEYFLKNAS